MPLGAQNPAEPSPTLALQTLDLEVDPARQSAAVSQQFDIKINEDIANQFGTDNPLQWAPDLTQKSLNPTREFGVSHGPVSLGFTPDFDISISFDRRPLLFKDGVQESRALTLTVNKPGKLKPGVYEGLIVSELHALKTGDKRPFAWPVRLRVQGTSVTSIKFLAVDESVSAPALRVGMSASVRVHVRTIECEPTGGQFELTWKRDQNSPDAADPVVRLPLLATQGWIDPKVSLPAGAHCDSEWLQDPLMVQLVGSTASNSEGVHLHEFQILLPQVFDVGHWTAKISWPEFAGQTSASETVHSLVARSGVRVQPAMPAIYEDVELIANLDMDAGAAINLQITYPDRTLQTLEAQKVDGACYRAVLPGVPTNGQYTVQILSSNQASGPTVFEVPFTTQDDLQERDLFAFVGAPYIPFDWYYGAKWGGGWEALRQNAYYLETNPKNFRDLRASLTGIACFKGEDGSQEQLLTEPVHWAREPEFSFPGHPSGKGSLAVYDKELQSNLAPGLPLIEWTADPANHSIGFDLNASVRDGENEQNSPRQITGPREFEMRLLVSGKSAEGLPMARIVIVPFGVSIYTEWQYYIPFSLYSLIAVIAGGVTVAVYRWMTPKVPRSAASPITAPSEQRFEPGEDYSPQVVHPTTAPAATAEGAAVASTVPPESAWLRGMGESQSSSTTGSAGGVGVSSGFGPEE